MSANPNIFTEETRLEADYQRAYDSHQELLELTCRVLLLKTAKDKQWRFTKTDARNLALAFLDTRSQSESHAAKGRALIRKIYEDKIVKVTEMKQEAQNLLEKETSKVNELFHHKNSTFTSKIKFWTKDFLMDADQYVQIANFTFQGKKKNNKGLLLALLTLNIDIEAENLATKSVEIPALREEVKQLMAEYDQYEAIRKGPDQILKRLDEVDDRLTAFGLWKKYNTQFIILLTILLISFFAFNYFSNPSPVDSTEKTLLPLVLSERVPLLEEDKGEKLTLIDESIAQQPESAYQISIKLTNYDEEVRYYLDAVLLTLNAPPSRVASPISAIADKAHFFIEDEAMYYSIRFVASDQMRSEINPRHSKFMEILVSGENDLEGLELTFDIAVVVHDQFTNTDTIKSAKPYTVIF